MNIFNIIKMLDLGGNSNVMSINNTWHLLKIKFKEEYYEF